MNATVGRCELAPGFSISRVLIGLWQIADMEREGRELDPVATARAMAPYVQAGFSSFDMADHYGSAEVIAGLFAQEHGHDAVQLFTKWVPTPGPASRDDVRTAVQTALDRLRSDRLDLLQFHAWNYADPSYLDTLTYLQELKADYTVVLVPHSVQQAARVADFAAFLLDGELVEIGPGEELFTRPQHAKTEDYVTGRFG